MRRIRRWLRAGPGACLLLALIAAASVVLNADFQDPPRFDGAGYAMLGEALATGRGYREISQPGSPRHAHFPPGYPAALAALWRCTGRSVAAAHVLSAICTVIAVLLAWRWFLVLYPPGTALGLGLALAINWTWGRAGGAIQSEPLYMAGQMLAVLVATRAGRRDGIAVGVALGVLLGGCVLIRHVGVCLLAAVAVDLALRRRWKTLIAALLAAVALIVPWAGWLALVRHNTQVGLLGRGSLGSLIVSQAVFYTRRLPDQVAGPFVEVGTVFRRSRPVAAAAQFWAVATTGLTLWGLIRTLRSDRRRLAGLIAFLTFALLLVWPFTEAGRFLIPLLPFLLVGATEGLAHLMRPARIRRPRGWAVGMILLVSVPYAAYAVATGRAAAQRRTHAEFDAACGWIARHATRPGLILTRHPGEVFWQTNRQAISPDSSEVETIARLIEHLGVDYLLIDEDRFANEAENPLAEYVRRYPGRVSLVWSRTRGASSIQVWETRPRLAYGGPASPSRSTPRATAMSR